MDHSKYLCYLLRMWQARQGNNATWHASLDDPRTGERHGFVSLDSLVTYLREQTDANDTEPDVNSEKETG